MSRQPIDLQMAASRIQAVVEQREAQQAPAGEFGVRQPHAITKASTQRLDPFSEVGTTGLRQFGGYVLEEWLASLTGRKGAWVWREMQDNDPTVGAIMFAIRWMARGVEWRVEEGAQPEAALLVEESMDDMSHTWGDFVSEALSFLGYGWAFHEEVYKVCRGPQPDGPLLMETAGADTTEDTGHPASSKYNDGKIRWRKLPIRAQETLLRWGFDGYSGLSFMEQIDWHGGNHKIPIQKALLFRTQTTRNNPEGRSILRNAYTSYWALKNLKQIEAIGLERDAAGIPVATPPENVDLFAPGNAQLLARVQQMVTNLRRDEYEGVVLPTSGWQLELIRAAGARSIDPDVAIRRYRQDIATSVLADFVLIGQDSVGSFAMVDVKSDLWGVALDGILDLICEVINRYSIPRLLRLNGMATDDPPRIAHGSARKIDLERVGSFLQAISYAGAPIPWSIELLKALFLDAGLPAEFETATAAEDLPGQQPDPMDLTGRETVQVREGDDDEDPDAEPVEKAEGTPDHRHHDPDDPTPVTTALAQRHRLLSAHLDREIAGALSELGEHAATAYLSVATKASQPGMPALHRLVARVMRAVDLQGWVQGRLMPLLRNHAARTTLDTARTIQTEINLEVGVADQDAMRIADMAGQHIGLRDIEPQIRASILRAIREGFERGDNPQRTADRIRQSVPAGRFVHAGPAYRARLISRSETGDLQRAATLAAYRSNPHVVAVRLRDGIYGPPRSDGDCIARDGDEVPIDEIDGVHPNHPLCSLGYEPVIAQTLARQPELAAA